MNNVPFAIAIKFPEIIPGMYDSHILRKLSSMQGQFLDEQAFTQTLSQEDLLLYEVYNFERPKLGGELDS